MAGDGFDDLRKLVVDLSTIPERLNGAVDRVMEKGALNIKTDWRAGVDDTVAFKHLQYAVSYSRIRDADFIGAEIGYDKARVQGPLGNIREFGTADVAGHLDGQRALDAEEPRLIAALEEATEGAVLP